VARVGAGLVIVACGGYIYVGEQRNGVPLDVVNIRDPVPPDAQSLAIGKDVYTTNCETCHGETGREDDPDRRTGVRGQDAGRYGPAPKRYGTFAGPVKPVSRHSRQLARRTCRSGRK